ncbi:hypothetical protein VHEMI08761 [[Torrubiella] hemipterigena]|nr:hypothetical protein VHEMI08761 [[Torrubiella] hemipterigena]
MTQIGGVGHHVQAVPVETFQTWLKLSKVLEFTYTPAVMFAKLAALFLYHQVFAVHSGYRFVFLAIGIVVVLQGIISFILAFSICRPFRYFWTQAVDINDGSCGDVMLFYKSYSIPSLVTDLAMLVVPWPILLRLQMPTSEKIGLFFTFLAGSLGIITCALRFSVFFTTPLFSDPTWYASGGPMIYALVEPSIYMIASILPTTRHLYRRLYRRVLQEYGPNSEATPKDSGQTDSTELERMESDHTSSGGIRRQVDIWQIHTSPSQEQLTKKDLTPKEWYPPRSESPVHGTTETKPAGEV